MKRDSILNPANYTVVEYTVPKRYYHYATLAAASRKLEAIHRAGSLGKIKDNVRHKFWQVTDSRTYPSDQSGSNVYTLRQEDAVKWPRYNPSGPRLRPTSIMIKIIGDRGEAAEKIVPGFLSTSFPGLGIHREDLKTGPGKQYAITHLRSGMAVATRVGGKAQAATIASGMSEFANWDVSENIIHKSTTAYRHATSEGLARRND